MTIIKFNNTTFEVTSFNKSTYFNGNLVSAATCELEGTNVDALEPFLTTPITTLQIYYNDALIYDLQNITARIDAINEVLEVNHMGISVNITFNPILDNE